jgi:hypothetical protein
MQRTRRKHFKHTHIKHRNIRKKHRSNNKNIRKTQGGNSIYFLEIRSSGYAKKYVQKISSELNSKFGSQHSTKPHITLFGPFSISGNTQGIISAIIQVCKKYENPNLIYYNLKGFNSFGKEVIYLDVNPSEDLKNIRYDLAQKLLPITNSISTHDNESKNAFNFHMTLAFKNIGDKFNIIWNYVKKKEVPHINQHLLRVALLKNSKILYEYDLILKRALDRRQALSKGVFRHTVIVFNELKKKHYGSKHLDDKIIKRKTIWEKLTSFFR